MKNTENQDRRGGAKMEVSNAHGNCSHPVRSFPEVYPVERRALEIDVTNVVVFPVPVTPFGLRSNVGGKRFRIIRLNFSSIGLDAV
jgi:hypothetical protein